MRARLRPITRLPSLLATVLLLSCGGGGGGGGATDPEPPTAGGPGVRISGASPVAAGCDGGRRDDLIFVGAEVEPWAAVSPADPNRLVAVWQQDRSDTGGARALASARSTDGGRSWQLQLQPMSRCGGAAPGSAGDHERVTDPWVDIGPDGTVHLMGLAITGNSFAPGSSNAMLAQRSTDGGATWSPPAVLLRDGPAFFNDKNTLTADPTDARLVYAVWDRLDSIGNGPTMLARSTDGGLSWEPARAIFAPQVVGGVSQTIGNRIVVITAGPERGTLVNVFTQIDSVVTGSSARVRVQRSTDRGATWSDPITVADWRSVGTTDPETGAAVRGGAGAPAVATGPSGELWVAWQDARFSGGRRDAIALSRSTDGGRSWSAPVAASRDASVAAFLPALAVRADGTLALLYVDLRSNTADRATLLADLWLATTSDGTAWSETALARAFDLDRAAAARGGRFLGDYQALVVAGSRWLAVAALPGLGAAGDASDVHALPAPAFGSSAYVARDAGALEMEPGFERARQAALRRALDARRGREAARGSPGSGSAVL
ncbi:MAG: sialidase family protein [Rubrivivax sp.]